MGRTGPTLCGRRSKERLSAVNAKHDLLRLEGIRTTEVREVDGGLQIDAETIAPSFPICCGLFRDLVSDGARAKRRIINDTQHGGVPCVILMKVRRAKCRHCGKKGIDEQIPHVRPHRHMTERCFQFIAKRGLSHTNTSIGRLVGVSEGTARSIVHEYIDGEVAKLNRATPRVLGVDEKKIVGAYRAVLGNLEKHTILDMLPDRDSALESYLERLPDKHQVEVFVSDMYPPYARVCKRYLPGIVHVTDRFHVVRRANVALDKVRTAIASGLDGRQRTELRNAKRLFSLRDRDLDGTARDKMRKWGLMYPTLSEAYWAKERYFEMYEVCHTPAEAEAYYEHWMRTLPRSISGAFEQYCKIQPFWKATVFAYFDHPYTTGFIEALNRVVDDLNRAGRGYSFEIIRGKMILSPKVESFTFRPRAPTDDGEITSFSRIVDHFSTRQERFGMTIDEMDDRIQKMATELQAGGRQQPSMAWR